MTVPSGSVPAAGRGGVSRAIERGDGRHLVPGRTFRMAPLGPHQHLGECLAGV